MKQAHNRRAAALKARMSEPGATLPTEDEIAARVKRARESGRGLTVEKAAMDSSLVFDWWNEGQTQ